MIFNYAQKASLLEHLHPAHRKIVSSDCSLEDGAAQRVGLEHQRRYWPVQYQQHSDRPKGSTHNRNQHADSQPAAVVQQHYFWSSEVRLGGATMAKWQAGKNWFCSRKRLEGNFGSVNFCSSAHTPTYDVVNGYVKFWMGILLFKGSILSMESPTPGKSNW